MAYRLSGVDPFLRASPGAFTGYAMQQSPSSSFALIKRNAISSWQGVICADNGAGAVYHDAIEFNPSDGLAGWMTGGAGYSNAVAITDTTNWMIVGYTWDGTSGATSWTWWWKIGAGAWQSSTSNATANTATAFASTFHWIIGNEANLQDDAQFDIVVAGSIKSKLSTATLQTLNMTTAASWDAVFTGASAWLLGFDAIGTRTDRTGNGGNETSRSAGATVALVADPPGWTWSSIDTRFVTASTGSKGRATATGNKSAAVASSTGSRTSQLATVAKVATGASTTSARGSQTAVGIRSASSTSTVQARTGQTAVGVRRALGVSLAGARGSQAATGFKVATSASLAKAVGVDTATVFKIASSASLLFSKGVVVSIGSQPGGGTRTGSSLISARGAVTSTGFKVTTGASALKARTVTTATSFKLVSTASTAKARGVATATGIRSALANSSTGARSAASAVALKRVLGFSSVRAQTLGGAQATKTSGAISTVRARGVVISVHPPINATPFATPTTGPTRPHLSRSSDGHLDTPDMGSSGRIQIGRIS